MKIVSDYYKFGWFLNVEKKLYKAAKKSSKKIQEVINEGIKSTNSYKFGRYRSEKVYYLKVHYIIKDSNLSQ